MQSLLVLIGHEFIKWIQRLITSAAGEERTPIPQQIDQVVSEAISMPVEDLFSRGVGKHVYYIIGFLCAAGTKEAKRRTKRNDVGKCVGSLSDHFAFGREEEKVRMLKSELPSGLAVRVDERDSLGGLKYPDVKLYTVFAVIEKVYSKLATPTNFMMFGGQLMTRICAGILNNETLIALFSDLFDTHFSEDTIFTAMQYYIGVFGNLRSKDLCYRFNSNLLNSASVGLRQSLAAGGNKLKSEAAGNIGSSMQTATELALKLTIVCVKIDGKLMPRKRQARLPKEYKREWKLGKNRANNIHAAVAGDADVSEDDEQEILPEPIIGPDAEHAELQRIAHTNIDAYETYQKLCTTDKEMEERVQ